MGKILVRNDREFCLGYDLDVLLRLHVRGVEGVLAHREQGVHHDSAGVNIHCFGVSRFHQYLWGHVQEGAALGGDGCLVVHLDAEPEVCDFERREILRV